jgi:putative transposase
MQRKPYPSDLTDAQWSLLEPWIPGARPGGRPRKTPMRAVVNAIFYLTREGCTWRALPHDFPPWKTVYNYFVAWQRDGTWDRFLTALRVRVREAAGRHPQPRVACIDSQSVKTAGGGDEVGTDGGKKVRGRKRHIAVSRRPTWTTPEPPKTCSRRCRARSSRAWRWSRRTTSITTTP